MNCSGAFASKRSKRNSLVPARSEVMTGRELLTRGDGCGISSGLRLAVRACGQTNRRIGALQSACGRVRGRPNAFAVLLLVPHERGAAASGRVETARTDSCWAPDGPGFRLLLQEEAAQEG